MKNLKLKVNEILLNQTLHFIEDPVLRAINRYEKHLSIKEQKEMVKEQISPSVLRLLIIFNYK